MGAPTNITKWNKKSLLYHTNQHNATTPMPPLSVLLHSDNRLLSNQHIIRENQSMHLLQPPKDTASSPSHRSPVLLRRKSESESPSPLSSNIHICFFLFCALFVLIQTQAFQLIQHIWSPGYFSPFHQENIHHNWCPKATCNNSPACQPCRQRFLIVIATGRSGSTTLTNMLDLLPNVRMAGENNAQLRYGLEAMQNLEETHEFGLKHTDGVVGAWKHHPIPKQSIACPIQKMYEAINPPPMADLMSREYNDNLNANVNRNGNGKGGENDLILGFKTVRFHGVEFLSEEGTGDLLPAAKFMLENFPCARFVINIRGDVEKQVESWEAAFGTPMDGDEVRRYNRWLVDVASYMGQDKARLVDMTEWIEKDSGVEVLNDLIEWLGFVDCRYESLLHSNKDGYGIDRQQVSLGKNCHYRGN